MHKVKKSILLIFQMLNPCIQPSSVSYSLEAIQHSTSSNFPDRIIPRSIRLWTSLLNSSQYPNECPRAPEWYLQVSLILSCSFNSFGRDLGTNHLLIIRRLKVINESLNHLIFHHRGLHLYS